MLALQSNPTTTPTSFAISRLTSPLPHPKSMIFSPGCGARRDKTGEVNCLEYTNGATYDRKTLDQLAVEESRADLVIGVGVPLVFLNSHCQ